MDSPTCARSSRSMLASCESLIRQHVQKLCQVRRFSWCRLSAAPDPLGNGLRPGGIVWGPAVKFWLARPLSRRAASKPPRATHKSGRASAQAVWLRRRRSSINEPIASPPSATTGMTKRALRIVPPHCRTMENPTAAGNLNHLSRPDGSCLAGWRAVRNSRWGEFIITATPDDRVRARPCACAPGLSGPQTVRGAG